MYLIAGLGNPTKAYEGTRHNIGFEVIDRLSGQYAIPLNMKKGRALCGTGVIEGAKVMLAKPQTYMNLSGEAVHALVSFYKLEPEQVIIIFDDISLKPGQIRVRKKGSAGGHNGMKNIIAHLGTNEFARIRVGIGEKPPGWDLADYVLSRFDKDTRRVMDEAVADAADAAALILREDVDAAMNRYNAKKHPAAEDEGPHETK